MRFSDIYFLMRPSGSFISSVQTSNRSSKIMKILSSPPANELKLFKKCLIFRVESPPIPLEISSY